VPEEVSMIRAEVAELVGFGRFPASVDVDTSVIERQQNLLQRIVPPVSDTEARELVRLFGPDDYYGLAWTLVHLVEGAPHWPLVGCLLDASNEWIMRLKTRAAKRSTSTHNES
jgi:hypothetical protein